MTIQNAPPGLDYDRDKKFSKVALLIRMINSFGVAVCVHSCLDNIVKWIKWFCLLQSFKEMVAMCLVKDQTKRPTAEKLLKHSFFKTAKPPELSVKKLFTDLPPLWHRVKALQVCCHISYDTGLAFIFLVMSCWLTSKGISAKRRCTASTEENAFSRTRSNITG